MQGKGGHARMGTGEVPQEVLWVERRTPKDPPGARPKRRRAKKWYAGEKGGSTGRVARRETEGEDGRAGRGGGLQGLNERREQNALPQTKASKGLS